MRFCCRGVFCDLKAEEAVSRGGPSSAAQPMRGFLNDPSSGFTSGFFKDFELFFVFVFFPGAMSDVFHTELQSKPTRVLFLYVEVFLEMCRVQKNLDKNNFK